MKQFINKIPAATAIAGGTALALGLALYVAGARVNTTRSIAVGLYWTSSKPIEKGDYVLFCPPQVGVMEEAKQRGYLTSGLCPGNYGYLMKKILAVKDDAVSIADAGVTVNGAPLPLSVPLSQDHAGRPLPRFQSSRFVIGNSEVLLMSDVSAMSFDGRYFGPINRAQIKTVIVPVFTW